MDIREILSWERTEVKILGQIFAENNMVRLNFDPIITTEQSKRWLSHSHTLEGKETLINIYSIPKLLNRPRNIPITEDIIKALTNQVFQFLWKSQLETIKRDKKRRGIGLIDIKTRIKTTQIKKLGDMLSDPERCHNLLLRTKIGHSPKINTLSEQIGRIRLILIMDNHTEIVRGSFRTKMDQRGTGTGTKFGAYLSTSPTVFMHEMDIYWPIMKG